MTTTSNSPTPLEPRVAAALKRDPALAVFGFDGVRELCAQPYNVDGHVCPVTGREAMNVSEAWAREDCTDRTFWLYSIEAADMGLECWRMLDGIDASVDKGADGMPLYYSLDHDGTGSTTVNPRAIVYMQRSNVERSAPGEGPEESCAAAAREAAAIMGSQRALAEALDVKPPTVNEWCKGDKPVPPAKAPLIESLTGGRVTCEQVCPKVPWHLVRGRVPDVTAIVREFLAAQQALDAAQARRPPVPAELMRAAERYGPAHRALATLAQTAGVL